MYSSDDRVLDGMMTLLDDAEALLRLSTAVEASLSNDEFSIVHDRVVERESLIRRIADRMGALKLMADEASTAGCRANADLRRTAGRVFDILRAVATLDATCRERLETAQLVVHEKLNRLDDAGSVSGPYRRQRTDSHRRLVCTV